MGIKNKLASFLLASSFSLCANEATFPAVIDFGHHQASIYNYGLYESESWLLGQYAFNFAPELAPFFTYLKRDFRIDTVVETGTFLGGSTVMFSLLFDHVHTIEVMPETYCNSRENLKAFSNVNCYLGSSEQVLNEMLPFLQTKRVLFYLDAHWHSHWPLLDELEEISRTHKDNCIIVIDDFKVPGRPDIPYDFYGPHECSYEYVREKLDKLFSDYTIHYLIPKSVHSRAKLVVIPKKWTK